jgi:hypothetical protein
VSLLIRDRIDPARAQTHVLVIGVNTYPYLKGGTLSGTGIGTHMGLGQLAAPVRSASAVAEFFDTLHENPDAPLGSIAALLSTGQYAPPGAAAPTMVDEPTFANIKTYVTEWVKRLDAHRDGVGVFYFCGHGVEPSVLLLLPQDFGDEPLDPWNKAINFTSTYANLAQVAAKTQVFMIDACRESPTDVRDAALNQARGSGSLGQSLIGVIPNRIYRQRSAPLITAAPIGQKAYAPATGTNPSFFATAIVECFARGGAERFDGQYWIVSTDSLGRNMKERLRRVKLPNGGTAACDDTGTSNFSVDLHRFAGPASVLTRITTNPQAVLAQATLELDDSVGAPRRRTPAPEPWEDELQTDVQSTWELRVDLPPGAQWTTKVMKGLRAHPPLFTPVVRWP